MGVSCVSTVLSNVAELIWIGKESSSLVRSTKSSSGEGGLIRTYVMTTYRHPYCYLSPHEVQRTVLLRNVREPKSVRLIRSAPRVVQTPCSVLRPHASATKPGEVLSIHSCLPSRGVAVAQQGVFSSEYVAEMTFVVDICLSRSPL